MSLPILTIIGATGSQGGSVVDAALKSGKYTVRAITRNTSSDKAKDLIARGAQVVSADLNNEASLIKAFEGSTAIYAVTDFFEPFASSGPEKAMEVEVAQGQNLARAASKTATLKHYIWSTLPNGKKVSKGKYLVPHFDAKNKIDDFIKADARLFAKTTFLWITFYASNFIFPMFTPIYVKTAGQYIQLSTAPASTPVLSIGDVRSNVGAFAISILDQPSLTHSRFVLASVEETTVGELFATWGRATGNKTTLVQVTHLQEFDNVWPNWGHEMGIMMEFWGEAREQSWSGEDFLTKEDLGLKHQFVGIEAALKGMDWKAIL